MSRKARFEDSPLSKRILTLVKKGRPKVLAVWAADCAKRVLPFFEKEFPNDDRPRTAIRDCRKWVRTGVFRMADVRGASLAAHAAARNAKADSPARFAARAAGQAMATAHVKEHSYAAAWYAVKAVWAAHPRKAETEVEKERKWQYEHLKKLGKKKKEKQH